MIQIKSNTHRNLDQICNEHFNLLEPFIRPKLLDLKNRQREFIGRNLETILMAKPEELADCHAEYVAYCSANGREQLTRINFRLKSVFNYKWFTRKDASYYCGYELAKKIDVRTCPYCNRNYTITVSSDKQRIVRPDFDHFFSQEHYPLLSLSFYNLIPSCSICNRTIKNRKRMVYGKYLHPYEEGYSDALKLNYFPKNVESSLGIKSDFLIIPVTSEIQPIKVRRCLNSFDLFKIKEIYEESHCFEISEIIRKYHISGGRYLLELQRLFPELGSIEELYRIAFGNFYNDEDMEKRPLSKLTRDVVEQLNFTFPIRVR